MRTKRRPMIAPSVRTGILARRHRDGQRRRCEAAYPTMAPVEQYRVAGASEEIALSRSAAPVSISGDASVLTLGDHGYDTAYQGKNGFVCLVQRSWAAGFDEPEFWNPKLRSPICFNPAAARTVLPSSENRVGHRRRFKGRHDQPH